MSTENNGFAAFLNRHTGNIVDWNRVGELLKSGSHNYSYKELYIRGAIVLSTTLSTYLLGSLLSNVLGQRVSYLMGFLISFPVIHRLAIEKLVAKRLAMKAEVEALKAEIMTLTRQIEDASKKEAILNRINDILKSEAKNNASSATLGMRKRLLSELLVELRVEN